MRVNLIKLYEDREDVTLTSYILDNSPEMPRPDGRAAVIICPGGGYLTCSDREGEPVALAFAAMGYHAFVLRYSVYYSSGQSTELSHPDEPKAHCIFPNPMLDIAKAVLTIRENAEAWHVDTKKIALCGFSAGGHNCAMYSVYWNKPIITDYFAVEPEALRPSACILGYPITDYFGMRASAHSDPIAKALHSASKMAYFGMSSPKDEMYEMASPARLVDSMTPPMFLWSTCEDGLVHVRQTILMTEALAECAIPFEVHVFERGPHGLSLANESSAGFRSQIDRDAAGWLDLCEAWLKKRFAPRLPAEPN